MVKPLTTKTSGCVACNMVILCSLGFWVRLEDNYMDSFVLGSQFDLQETRLLPIGVFVSV